jgi:hypothetical protein
MEMGSRCAKQRVTFGSQCDCSAVALSKQAGESLMFLVLMAASPLRQGKKA